MYIVTNMQWGFQVLQPALTIKLLGGVDVKMNANTS